VRTVQQTYLAVKHQIQGGGTFVKIQRVRQFKFL